MARLNDEIKKAIEDLDLFPLATASAQGVPNVVPIKFVFVEDEGVLWLVDNFFNKTLENIRGNPQGALYVYRAESDLCVQIKGTLEIQNSGPDYERMRQQVHSTRPDLPARSLVVMRVTGLFQCMPGPDAGAEITS